MRTPLLAILTAAVAVAFASGASAQSAKFAASWDDTPIAVKAEIASGDAAGTCTGATSGSGTSADPCVVADMEVATIHVAQQKDLLIGVSGEIGLITLTQAKGKSADSPTPGEASAEGSVLVTLELRDANTGELVQTAAPGPVIFARRLQEIKVSTTTTLDTDTVDVIVSLKLDTMAAHHFNFLGVDLPQGDYDVVAVFDLSAFVGIVGEDAIASADVILNKRMVTAQEVRAAKGTLTALDPN